MALSRRASVAIAANAVFHSSDAVTLNSANAVSTALLYDISVNLSITSKVYMNPTNESSPTRTADVNGRYHIVYPVNREPTQINLSIPRVTMTGPIIRALRSTWVSPGQSNESFLYVFDKFDRMDNDGNEGGVYKLGLSDSPPYIFTEDKTEDIDSFIDIGLHVYNTGRWVSDANSLLKLLWDNSESLYTSSNDTTQFVKNSIVKQIDDSKYSGMRFNE